MSVGLSLKPSVLGSSLLWRRGRWADKFRWHLNTRLTRQLPLLAAFRATLTIVDAYGSPGDTLLTAAICRQVHERYPQLRLNCLTPNPELLVEDPNLATLNCPETFFSVWSWYPDLAGRRDRTANVLSETFARLGWGRAPFAYRARVYLTAAERIHGRSLLGPVDRPVLTLNTRSKEDVKNWPVEHWRTAVAALRERFHLVQLGDATEPALDSVHRLAGRLSLRESMAVLSHAHAHLGADSFLMHAANGLDVPAVIIFGGSRLPANLGYAENINLASLPPCAPCWLQPSRGDRCPHGLVCLHDISPAQVLRAVDELLARPRPA